ncbi:LytTR family transcriptional regulator DNA-binding domain-containing protein [Streptococcus sp. 10F2]
MKVLILEDQVHHQIRLEGILEELGEELQQKLDIQSTGKLEEFMAYHAQAEVHQLYFLDIEIQDQKRTGLEVAREIRQNNPYAIIVFTSSHSEFALLTFRYQVAALDFIPKDLEKDLFRLRIRKVLEYSRSHFLDLDTGEDFFDFSTKGERLRIPFQDIFYIETAASSHKLRIVGKNFIKEFSGTLQELRRLTDGQGNERFFCPHKSYLANIQNIRGWDSRKKEVLFSGQASCPLSRLRFTAMKELLDEKK